MRAMLLIVLTVGVVVAARLLLKAFFLNGAMLVLVPLAFLGLSRGLGLDKYLMPSRIEARTPH